MAYGIIKVDTITFTDGGVDKSVSISGLVQNPTFSGNITVTGTISGDTVRGQTVSGVTVTGTTAQFTSGTFTSITGGTATIASGVFASGTASAPTLTFTGDLNTGIYSPGADQVAISTGGSGRLFVDASGRVGIGVSTPNDDLEIRDAVAAIRLTDSDSLETTRIVQDFLTTQIINSGAGDIRFSNNGSERLRITSAGLVGIGTSSPVNLLHVQGDATFEQNAGGQFAIRGSTSSSNRFNLGFDTTSNYAWLQAITVGTAFRPIALNPAGGNVGIGTASPAQLLEVSSTTPRIRITDSNTTASAATTYLEFQGSDARANVIFSDSTGLNIQADAAGGNNIAFNTNGSNERARIDSSGRLGIGESNPSALLHLKSSANTTLRLADTAGSYSDIIYNESGTVSQLILDADPTGSSVATGGTSILLKTDGSTAMTIDSSQRVGIGTSSPQNLFHLRSDVSGAATQLYLMNRTSGASV